jgi:serine/threonine protein kinase
MGAIYKVRHRLLDEIRVIKLMRQQFVEDEELKARFLREARLAIKLRHPNIAQLYDFTIDDDGIAFIVMEFIDGMTLEDVLASHGPPPLDLALEIAQQSLKALGYLHMKGFVHRDISPDNIMLTEDMEEGHPLIKLIDLGIAKTLEVAGESRVGQLTQAGTFLGKLRYASPEQFGADGATMVDARGDLYSFGIVLYELLTARFPIQGRDSSSMIAGHLFRPPLAFDETDPSGRVPADLRSIVLRTLAKSPADRFANAADLSRALAVFRSPIDIPRESLRAFLARPSVQVDLAALSDSGSTQGRLDRHFELSATPSPGRLLALTEAAVPSPAPSGGGTVELALRPLEEPGELAAALAEITAALEKRSYRLAESLLYAAEASFGPREEFVPLYDQVAEERREDLARQAGRHLESARRFAGAGDVAGALTEVQHARRLDPGSRTAATVLAEVEAVRKRQEEIARLLAAARVCIEGDDLKGALRELHRAVRLDPADGEACALLAETEAAEQRKAAERRREQKSARDAKKIQERLDGEDLEGAEKLLDRLGAEAELAEPFALLRERLNQLRRAARRAKALTVAVSEIHDALDRDEQAAAGDLLDRAVVLFGAVEPLREQWQRLEQMRAASKAEAARRRQAEEEESRALFEAAQEIADLLSRRQAQAALKALHAATARFGERVELLELHKRIAGLLLDD